MGNPDILKPDPDRSSCQGKIVVIGWVSCLFGGSWTDLSDQQHHMREAIGHSPEFGPPGGTG
eukprot:scaffold2120_cov31-Attheya_sp.AAC.3